MTLTVSLRECRLVVGRALRVLGVPRGAVPAIRDSFLTAEVHGFGGLAILREGTESLRQTAHLACTVHGSGAEREVEAHGRHALAVVPDLLDLGSATLHRHGTALLRVRSAHRPETLEVLTASAGGFGLTARVSGDEVSFARAPVDPVWPLEPLLRSGAEVTDDLWWSLYELGNQALTEDSPLSRQHAGRSLFDEQGNIVGEIGEDLASEEPKESLAMEGK